MDDPLIYVGPNSAKLGLRKFKSYTGLTEQVQDAIKANPALGILLIPLSRFASVREQVYNNTPGSMSHAADQLIKDGIL